MCVCVCVYVHVHVHVCVVYIRRKGGGKKIQMASNSLFTSYVKLKALGFVMYAATSSSLHTQTRAHRP